MNKTSVNCDRPTMDFSSLTQRQVDVVAIANLVVMTGNVVANILVIYILIKTAQTGNNTFKLILMLSVSDLMMALFVQNLQTAILYEKKCILMDIYGFAAVFILHLSMYTIAIIGIDRYIRIKHYVNFKTLWTTRVVLTLIFIEVFLSLLQAMLMLIGFLAGIEYITIPIYYTIDGVIISGIIYLQILTMRTSSAIFNESTVTTSESIDKKISKLSMQIMLLFCCFIVPHVIMFVLREFIRDRLSEYEKSLVDFFTLTSGTAVYTNSFANAVLFLMTNVKAKRFLRNFGRL